MIPVSVQHKLRGEPCDDPLQLQKELQLDCTGNLMINGSYPFSEFEKKMFEKNLTQSPGTQLALVLLRLGISKVDVSTLPAIMERWGFLANCGESPLQLCGEHVSELVPIYNRLKTWVGVGWTMETNLKDTAETVFYEAEIERMMAGIEKDIRAEIVSVKEYLKGTVLK